MVCPKNGSTRREQKRGILGLLKKPGEPGPTLAGPGSPPLHKIFNTCYLPPAGAPPQQAPALLANLPPPGGLLSRAAFSFRCSSSWPRPTKLEGVPSLPSLLMRFHSPKWPSTTGPFFILFSAFVFVFFSRQPTVCNGKGRERYCFFPQLLSLIARMLFQPT